MKKTILFFALLNLFSLTALSPAYALEIYWRPAGDNTIPYSQRELTSTNRIDIQVREDDAKDVTINGEEAIQIGGSDSEIWLLRNYMLQEGDNEIRAEAEKYESRVDDEEEATETDSLTLEVMKRPEPGAFRYFEEIGEGLEAFGGAFSLKFDEDTYVLRNNRAATYQYLTVRSTELPFSLAPDYIPLSPVYSIQSYSHLDTLSNPGRLTIQYEGDANTDGLITVLYALPNLMQPRAFQRLNSINSGPGEISVPFSGSGFGHYVVARVLKEFNDFYPAKEGKVDLGWAKQYVMPLWTRGIMDELDNYPDGSKVPPGYFGLTNSSGAEEIPATREEFVSMLVKGMRKPVNSSPLATPDFQDLQDLNMWERQHIEAALKAGWIPNTPAVEGKLYFHPHEPLNREFACAVLARAGNLDLPAPGQADLLMQSYFPKDYQSTYYWNRPHIIASIREGLVSPGQNGYFRPGKTVTRAETARMVYKFLVLNDKL